MLPARIWKGVAMDKKLYDLMDWAEIEAIVYSEHDHPEQVLGPRRVRGGILIQAFLPGAETMFVKNGKDRKLYPMEKVDEEGFFALLLPGKKIPSYELIARFQNGRETMGKDPYCYTGLLSLEGETSSFPGLGAHPVTVTGAGEYAAICGPGSPRGKKGEKRCGGTMFAVRVPNAMRVSVVGDFNNWDGRVHPMVRQKDSDMFALFVPEVGDGELYKFEVKWNAREMELMGDPCAFFHETPPSDACIVAEPGGYQWNDGEWMGRRKAFSCASSPMSIFEAYLGEWKREVVKKGDGGRDFVEMEYWNYREIARELGKYLAQMGYTHVQLLPVMEYASEVSMGYETEGYFAPTARYGTPQDFMYFVDYMHQKGIGVILDWVAVRKYQREGAAASDFLVENALFWKERYHVDGLRVTGMESILRLDYGKAEGMWLPNQYGGNEDLEGAAFLRRLSEKFHEGADGAILIGEDASAYPKVTEGIGNDGLGFDLKWNGGWTGDFLEYMGIDPLFRKGSHGKLIDGMLYAYSERFVLMFSHNQSAGGIKGLLAGMPGDLSQKFGNLRVALGYMMLHPGKKLLFGGRDFKGSQEWDDAADSSWDEAEKMRYLGLGNYIKQWNYFYQAHPALYERDCQEQGFEWISCMDADHSIIAFLRRAQEGGEELLAVCNFTPVLYENFRVGVPYPGSYKEIFNSDSTFFGGTGATNIRRVLSKDVGWDGREHSISIDVPPLGISIFRCHPGKEEEA